MKFCTILLTYTGVIVTLLLLTLVTPSLETTKVKKLAKLKDGDKRVKRNHKGDSLKDKNKGSKECEEIYLPMCRGLVPYSHTKFPNQFNHTSQIQVYRELERLWPYMDHSCSANLRLLACSSYLPKCHGPRPPLGPCKQTCMQAKKKCSGPLKEIMGLIWTDKFDCKGLPSKNCVKPAKEVKCQQEHIHCLDNGVLPICANLTFRWGTMPNMFGQCNINEVNNELRQYDALIATNCHLNLKFLLCGVYSPFCIRNEVPFTFPCREICEEIRQDCEPHYRRLYHDLPWPQKLQCHRYPTSQDETIECVMPNEGSTFFGGK